MSILKATEQILNFLHSDQPEIIVIKGEWGTGKTYLWNKYFTQEAKLRQIPILQYSYISLFGVKSAEELKDKISESLTPISSIVNEQSPQSILSNMIDQLTRLARYLKTN